MSDETKTQLAFSRQESLKMYHALRRKYMRLLELAREHVPAQLLLNMEIPECHAANAHIAGEPAGM